jgi:Chaperone of endosialidase
MSDQISKGNGSAAVTNGSVPVPYDEAVTPFAGTVGTDFLTFAVGSGANVEAQADYNVDPQRATGNLPGLARSNFNNKATRQGTFVAHSLTLWMSQQILEYINDDGDDIKWIGEWTRALSAYMLTLIPPGPNLGLYLPLAGGQMVGNITFASGISTILANNTWYFAKDTGGTNRGLILKSSDNNVYINDGSSVYVYFNGIPVTNNNVSWSGKDTTGTARAVVGLLSDNAVHVGSGTAGNIYLDTTAAGSVYFAGNTAHANNSFLTWRDTGGTYRNCLGMNAINALVIGSGVTGTTEIYAGGTLGIYLHNNTTALGQLTVNNFAYLNGGGRAYIAGGNDPFQILADSGFYARVHYTVTGVRDWSVGCSNAGLYSIADETAHAVRWEVDLSGHAHAYNNMYVGGALSVTGGVGMANFTDYGSGQVNGGLTVYNSLNVASGNLTVSGGTYAYNGLTVYNSINLVSGGISVTGGAYFNSGVTVYNSLNMASGTMTANGNLDCNGRVYSAGGLQIGGVGSALYDDGNNNLASAASRFYLWRGQIRGNNGYFDGDLVAYGNFYIGGGASTVQHLSCNNGLCVGGSGSSFDYTVALPIGNHTQWVGGLGVYAQFFAPYSDRESKRNISEVDRDALAAILPIKFYQYDRPRVTSDGEVEDARTHTATGLIAQQVRESLPDAVVETDEPVKFHEDHDEKTGAVGCSWDTRPALALDIMTMLAYSLRAIQQLAARVDELEGKTATVH